MGSVVSPFLNGYLSLKLPELFLKLSTVFKRKKDKEKYMEADY